MVGAIGLGLAIQGRLENSTESGDTCSWTSSFLCKTAGRSGKWDRRGGPAEAPRKAREMLGLRLKYLLLIDLCGAPSLG